MINWKPSGIDAGKPRYIAIADAISKDIADGRLAVGDRLPPQRRLAAELGIDFTTVSRAYAEAQARGLVDSHVGRGTFVAEAARRVAPDPARGRASDLSMNMPPEPDDPDLVARMQAALGYVSANLVDLLRYQAPLGTDRDREAASIWLSLRGMIPSMDRVAVTPGAHATMAAIFSIITRPGDRVLCEAVTYPGLRNIAGRFGIELVGLETDADGVTPDALEDAIARHAPKALYLNPTLQNPTTHTIPEARRQQVSEILNQYDLTLIEDDAYGFIPARAPAPIAVSSPDLTWHIGGLAKCIGAGLRLAYTIAPSPKCAHRLAQAIRALAVMPSPLSMALTTQWIEDGTADSIRRFIRAETAARQQIAAEALEGMTFAGAPNAFNVWLTLPPGFTRASTVARLAGRPLGVVPSDAFTVAGTPGEMLRVGLGGPISRDELSEHLHFLGAALSGSSYMG
ncbi:aminotransferase class I/II-fold pyridoxal phosphate-dependent enzyme [Rhodobacterales bacterium HKCCE2091]|nr:aminotransferase class I/II-fold pyridoxal phosphate-dependent enzyme [Rhodobacterales bacterium HKCCE2091]